MTGDKFKISEISSVTFRKKQIFLEMKESHHPNAEQQTLKITGDVFQLSKPTQKGCRFQ